MKILNILGCLGLVLMASTFVTGATMAAEAGAIQLKATASKVVVVVDETGVKRTEYVTPDRVVPGDKIAYTIDARNLSNESVEQVVITDPIPAEMHFVAGTEASDGARVLFSVDDGESFDQEGQLVVMNEDGSSRPATSADFTHIRWIFETPLAPSAERSVRFVARVQ